MAKLIMKLTPLAGVLVFLAVWEIAVAVLKVPVYLLPPPSQIIQVFVDGFAKIAFHGWVTLYEMLLGYALAVVIAIPLAIASLRRSASIVSPCRRCSFSRSCRRLRFNDYVGRIGEIFKSRGVLAMD